MKLLWYAVRINAILAGINAIAVTATMTARLENLAQSSLTSRPLGNSDRLHGRFSSH